MCQYKLAQKIWELYVILQEYSVLELLKDRNIQNVSRSDGKTYKRQGIQ